MNFGLRIFLCTFIPAAISKPILGVDILSANRLLVDPHFGQVLDATTRDPISGSATDKRRSGLAASLCHITPAVRPLLASFPAVVGDGSGTPNPKHGVFHSIETTGRPVFAKVRRLDPEKHRIAESEFQNLEKAGILRRSNSPWSSPLHMVPKPDGSWRPCEDYRRLNLDTKHNRYPLPSILDLSAKLHGCKFFSVVDLVKGYHQVPMSPADIQKTAIITPFGLFEYVFMPFGLMNAAQTFQRLMDRLFRSLPFVFTYLDDHLIASRTLEEHMEHLSQFFQVLQDNGLTINPAKCTFAATSVKFLGHMVSEAGIKPLPKHVAAIQEFPVPTTIKQLQQFLGMINFYRRFLPKIAATLRPLTGLLRGNPKTLYWSAPAAEAFKAAKSALVRAVPLTHPAPDATLSLAVDASDSHVGGVLQQLENRAWRPLAFFSQKLTPTQVRYSTFDRELLAAYTAVRNFRFLLEGRRVPDPNGSQTIGVGDDKSHAAVVRPTTAAPFLLGLLLDLSFLAPFTSDIRHTSGHSNIVADTLSRPPSHSKVSAAVVLALPTIAKPPVDLHANNPSQVPVPPAVPITADEHSSGTIAAAVGVDFAALAAAQATCPDVLSMQNSPSLQVTIREHGGVQLLGDISTGTFRPLVPAAFRTVIIGFLHSIHHPGVRATARLVKSAFCWPRMGKDITAVARSCMDCQLGKVHRHIKLQPEHIAVPRRRFAHLHVDIVGPLPNSAGNTHIFTAIDRTTRWPEAVPLSSTSAANCAAALFSGWIQRFGLPAAITSDRGPQFTSALWSALCKLLKITHQPTAAYLPQSNGLVERFHRRLKDALRARAAGPDWCIHLPWVMLRIRMAWREGTDFSPAEAVFGAQPVLPGQFVAEEETPSPNFLRDMQGLVSGRTVLPTSHHTTPAPQHLPEELLLAKHVLVRKDGHVPPLAVAYNGPYLVLERSLRFFKLQVGNKVDTYSTLRLRPCKSPPDVEVAQPPRRGRPPAAAAAAPPQSTAPAGTGRAKRRQVSFCCPVVVSTPPPAQLLHPSGRPARSAGPPKRFFISLVIPDVLGLGGSCGETTFSGGSSPTDL